MDRSVYGVKIAFLVTFKKIDGCMCQIGIIPIWPTGLQIRYGFGWFLLIAMS